MDEVYPQEPRLFADAVRAGKITFPYKRTMTTIEEIEGMMHMLRQYRAAPHLREAWLAGDEVLFERNRKVRDDAPVLEFRRMDIQRVAKLTDGLRWGAGPPTVLICEDEEYEAFGQLGDMFSEEERMQAKLKWKKMSPVQFFQQKPEVLAGHALKNFGEITPHSIRESIYALAGECTSHRPNLVMALVQELGLEAPSILDFSSGWGDRLLGAIAAGASAYHGNDPNSSLVRCYDDIIAFFRDDLPSDKAFFQNAQIPRFAYSFGILPAEDADFTKNEPAPPRLFDLAYTSPPYFDFESYVPPRRGVSDRQSSRFRDERAWFDKFLVPACENAIAAVRPGGYFALNLNQADRQNYVYWFLEWCSAREDLRLHGTLCYGHPPVATCEGATHSPGRMHIPNPQPIFVWQKL